MELNNQTSTSTEDFLARTERQRLSSECLRSLDLRQHSIEACKHYSYRGRSLWLDPTAHQLFLEGLDRNAGVFTVETYESILTHYDAFRPESKASISVQASLYGDERLTGGSVATDPSILPDQVSHNLAFDLSYFEKRVYDRVRLVLDVRLISHGQVLPAETRDLSVSGLQLRVKMQLQIREGDRVRVDVSPCVDRALEQPELHYRVVRIRRLLQETLVALQCIETEAKDGLAVIAEQVVSTSEALLEQQADPEDALLTAQAQLAERYYMRSTTMLPFFLFNTGNTGAPLCLIFANRINLQALQAFEISPGQYDFSTLLTLKRLNLLKRLALRNSQADTLIAVYRASREQSPKVMADLDCKNHKHWCRFLMQYVDQPGFRVFKVVARPAHQPVAMRIEDAVRPLKEQSDELMQQLLLDANSLSIVGALIDVTQMVRTWNLNAFHPDWFSADNPLQCAEDANTLAPPQLVPVRYIQENRSESRYLGQMQVELQIADQILTGETQDLSAHGLSIKIKDWQMDIERGQRITLRFPVLDARSTGLARLKGTFREVPADVVGISSGQDGEQQLRLRIDDSAKGRRFSMAFFSYLEQRQSRLRVDASHAMRAVTSRLYSSIFVESSSTLPVFIYRSGTQDCSFRLGLVSSPSPLSGFFELADGEFDVTALSKPDRLASLMQQVTEHGTGEVIIYLHKVPRKDAPAFVIHSLADCEITDSASRKAFVQRALAHDFRCVKIVASVPDIPPQGEIEQAIDRIMRLSPGKSERLKADFSNLIAIGDVVDITGLVEDIWLETDSE